MFREIEQEIEKFYNKEVRFNTMFGVLNEKTRSFKIADESYDDGTNYLVTARINEYEDYVEVIKVGIMKSIKGDFKMFGEGDES